MNLTTPMLSIIQVSQEMQLTNFVSKRSTGSQLQDPSHRFETKHFNKKDRLHVDQAIPDQSRSSMSVTQRTTLKKSVTFASVFDSIGNEYDLTNQLELSTNDKAFSEENLLKSGITDQTTVHANDAAEVYPFRSEIPLASNSSSHQTKDGKRVTTSHNSRRKFISHFIRQRHPKKLRHPIQTTDPIRTPHRSVSLNTLPTSSSSSTEIKENDSQQPSKSNRKRFKLPCLTRLTQFFNKKSDQNFQPTPVTCQLHPRRPSTGLRRFSELLY